MMNSSSPWTCFLYSVKCLCFTSASPSQPSPLSSSQPENSEILEEPKTTQRRSAGWKVMPYILGNESLERLATFGLLANLMVYLLTQFHLHQVSATVLLNVWAGTANVTPLIGAYISDSFLGKFRTIAYASLASVLGMMALALTAIVPELHPPKCTQQQQLNDQCIRPTSGQLGFLYMSLGLLAIGSGGTRPCSLPFGVDQFDLTTEEGKKGINSYFNWYFFTFTVVSVLASTIIVYIQDKLGSSWGLGILAVLMFCAVVLFFLGTRFYIYLPPGKSIFVGILQVFVSAYKKRGLKLPSNEDLHVVLHDPPIDDTVGLKLPLTPHFRWLTKAAIVIDGEVSSDGFCTIQQVEEVKCLVQIIPIWLSTILCFLSMTQQDTFAIVQAMKMDRHLGAHFQIPASTISVISGLTLAIWIPIYDRAVVPMLENMTKKEGGFTLLQRMGIGTVFSILSMFISGLVEEKRRTTAISHDRPDGISPMSVMWLVPQLMCAGFANAFSMIGVTEFLYKQFPDNMKSISNSLFFLTLAGSGYLSSLLVSIIHRSTGKTGHRNWLDNNINAGRLNYWYYLVGGMGSLNLVYFLVCANRYHYKKTVPVTSEGLRDLNSSSPDLDV